MRFNWKDHRKNLVDEYNNMPDHWTVRDNFVDYFNDKYGLNLTASQIDNQVSNIRKWQPEFTLKDRTNIPNKAKKQIVKEVIKEIFPADYEAQNKVILNQHKQIQKISASQDIFMRTMSTQILKLKPYDWNIKPPKKIKKTDIKAHSLCNTHLLLSDIHNGVNIKFQDVMGLSEYTPEICEERLNILADKVIQFHQSDMEIYGLNKLVIAKLGDMMEGTNVYPGQAFTVVMHELEQWRNTAELLCKFLIKMCNEFNEVEVFAIPGNHGWGSTKKGNAEGFLADSFLYEFIYALTKEIPNLKMYISDCPRMLVQHGGENFVYSHGNESRGYNGIPFYGLARVAQRLPNLLRHVVDHYIHAHFHTASNLNDGEIIGNGCFPGGSNLSVNKMSVASRPSQKQFYFGKRGIFNESNIYLADKPELIPDDSGIFTPYNSSTRKIDEIQNQIINSRGEER